MVSSGHVPKRDFASVEEFKTYFSKKGTILIDATEQRTQRPADSDYQKQIRAAGADFSGMSDQQVKIYQERINERPRKKRVAGAIELFYFQ